MTLVRNTLLAASMLAAALLLTACPKPNGYTAVGVFPQINFDQMLGLQPIPGDGAFAAVVSKDGLIRRADLANDSAPATTFLDISGRLIQNPGQEEGLLGLAFAPDYASSGKFYVYYSAGEPRRAVLSRFVAQGDHADPASEHVLLQIDEPFANHNGGSLAFGPDGMLYVGVGDGGSGGDPQGNGQNTNTLLGKILRIDVSGVEYAIPSDNPFVGQKDFRPEIWAYGFRNPWRMSFDMGGTRQLFVAEFLEQLVVLRRLDDYFVRPDAVHSVVESLPLSVEVALDLQHRVFVGHDA